MDMLKNLNTKAYYGFAIVLMLGVLFLLAVIPLLRGGKEGYYPAQGGTKGASYAALNDHTGASGDGTGYDQWNYDDDDLKASDPVLWYEMKRLQKEGFLNGRFPGPSFSESSARMLRSVEGPIVAALRSHDQQLAGLTQPPAVNEITQGPGTEGMGGIEACDWKAGSDPSAHVQGGSCYGTHNWIGHGDFHSSDSLYAHLNN